MKHIQHMQSILLNKEEYPDLIDWIEIKNVWGLLINTFEEKEPTVSEDGTTKYNMLINCKFVGKVTQDKGDNFECDIDSSFQAEYTEEELEQVIIQDIKEEYGDLFLPDYLISDFNVFSIMWDKLSVEIREIISNIIRIRYGVKAEDKLKEYTGKNDGISLLNGDEPILSFEQQEVFKKFLYEGSEIIKRLNDFKKKNEEE